MNLLNKTTFEQRYADIILQNKENGEAYIIITAILTDEASISFFHYNVHIENIAEHIISFNLPNKYGDLFNNIDKLEKDINDYIKNFMTFTNSTVREL